MSGGAPRIFLGVPCYTGGFTVHNTPAIMNAVARHPTAFWQFAMSSLLTFNFNRLWCEALNSRASGVTHFLLLHADVEPLDENWVELLLEEMQRAGAEVLSAVVPIKTAERQTSTAVDTDRWHPRRYTLDEVGQQSVTWSAPDLLVNTGLLIDLRRPWVEQICFTINDRIVHTPKGWEALAEPEDRNFSR